MEQKVCGIFSLSCLKMGGGGGEDGQHSRAQFILNNILGACSPYTTGSF